MNELDNNIQFLQGFSSKRNSDNSVVTVGLTLFRIKIELVAYFRMLKNKFAFHLTFSSKDDRQNL